jgi:hypothetical protein
MSNYGIEVVLILMFIPITSIALGIFKENGPVEQSVFYRVSINDDQAIYSCHFRYTLAIVNR